MLELRPNCENCDRDLPPESKDAMICTFECTFCRKCANEVFQAICPNCGGNFDSRLVRPAALFEKHPATLKRVTRT